MEGASGSIDDPTFVTRFLTDLERVTSEIFPKVDTLQGLLDYPWVPFLGTGMSPITHSLLLTALGRFAEAERLLADWVLSERRHLDWNARRIARYYRKGSKPWQRQQRSHEESSERLQEFEALLDLLSATSPGPVAALLHKWESLGVRKRRIERYWEQSPFPFELV